LVSLNIEGYGFEIETSSRLFKLSADTSQERVQWIEAIKPFVEQGLIANIIKVSKMVSFFFLYFLFLFTDPNLHLLLFSKEETPLVILKERRSLELWVPPFLPQNLKNHPKQRQERDPT